MNIQHVHSFLFLKYNVFYSYQKHMLLFSSILHTTCSPEGAGVPICFAWFGFNHCDERIRGAAVSPF